MSTHFFRQRLGWAPEPRRRFTLSGHLLSVSACGHASCVSNTPCPGGKIFTEPQRRFRRLRTAGTVRAVPARGQKGGHQGFHPFESRFLLEWHGEILRTETIKERQRIFSSVGAAIGRPFPHLYAMPDSLLLHIRFTLRRRG